MNTEIPEESRMFLENMLYTAEEFDYGEEIPEGLLQELYGKLNDWVSKYLLSNLPEDKISEYKKLNENAASPDILDIFSMKNIPNYTEVVKKAYRDYYDSYLQQIREDK